MYKLVKPPISAPQNKPSAGAKRLPRKTKTGSKVVPRCVSVREHINLSPNKTRNKRAFIAARQREAYICARGWRDRHGLQQVPVRIGSPDRIVIISPPSIFPTQAHVQSESPIDLEVILHKKCV